MLFKSDPHLSVVRGWQQSSKKLPVGAMPSVVKVHTEEPPRALREVERLSRNPENDWRTRVATGCGVDLPPTSKKVVNITEFLLNFRSTFSLSNYLLRPDSLYIALDSVYIALDNIV